LLFILASYYPPNAYSCIDIPNRLSKIRFFQICVPSHLSMWFRSLEKCVVTMGTGLKMFI
jgi:hypothetical protein